MTVLKNLKDWLTLEEASIYLSAEFSEAISVSDIIRLALDDRLQLSLRCVDSLPVKMVLGTFVDRLVNNAIGPTENQEGVTLARRDSIVLYALQRPDISESDKLGSLSRLQRGVVAPVVTRSVETILNNILAATIGGGISSVTNRGGILLRQNGGHYIQIRECADFHKRYVRPAEPLLESLPADTLPECASFVIKSEDLANFIGEARPNTKESRPLSTTERNTLLTVIAALCDYSDVHHQERGAATQIAKMTEEIGAPVTDDTIRKLLTKIPDALESRKK